MKKALLRMFVAIALVPIGWCTFTGACINIPMWWYHLFGQGSDRPFVAEQEVQTADQVQVPLVVHDYDQLQSKDSKGKIVTVAYKLLHRIIAGARVIVVMDANKPMRLSVYTVGPELTPDGAQDTHCLDLLGVYCIHTAKQQNVVAFNQ